MRGFERRKRCSVELTLLANGLTDLAEIYTACRACKKPSDGRNSDHFHPGVREIFEIEMSVVENEETQCCCKASHLLQVNIIESRVRETTVMLSTSER